MTRDGARPGRADARAAAVCAGIVLPLWFLLPILPQASEPGAAVGLPETGGLSWWVVLLLLVSQSAALARRWSSPEVVGVVVAVVVPVAAVAGMGSAIGLTSLAILPAVYALSTLSPFGRVWPLLSVIGVLVAGGHALAGLRDDLPWPQAVLAGVLQALVAVGAPAGVAALVVTRRESQTARDDRLQALEREHVALVLAAVSRERMAMARELHDIAAHHLTGIAIMSAAVVAQIDADPAGAKEAIAEVRRESTAVLRDLRNLVGLLRDHDGGAEQAARVESLAGVTGLVSEVATTGQDVALTTFGSNGQRPLGTGIGPLAQLAAYRTVQESLSNAGRHAAGSRCAVEIDDRDVRALVVTVRNAPGPPSTDPRDPGDPGGFGLVGMKERAELTGSRLDVGPTLEGGWQVRLRTPRDLEHT